jgi:hypothetical protein
LQTEAKNPKQKGVKGLDDKKARGSNRGAKKNRIKIFHFFIPRVVTAAAADMVGDKDAAALAGELTGDAGASLNGFFDHTVCVSLSPIPV